MKRFFASSKLVQYWGLAGGYGQDSSTRAGGCGDPYNMDNIKESVMLLRDAVLGSDCQLYAGELYFFPAHIRRFRDSKATAGLLLQSSSTYSYC